MSQAQTTVKQEQYIKSVQVNRVITAGPITAKQLGVPVGTVIHDQTVKWHRDFLSQLKWRWKSKDFKNKISFGR